MAHNTHVRGQSRQKGYISIEWMFALIAFAIGVGYALYNGGSLLGNSDVTNEQANIGQLIANIRKLKGRSGYGSSGTDLVAQLKASGGLPNMAISGTSLYNAWNGTVTVVSNGMTFTITENGLPQDACLALATKTSLSQRVTTSINGGSTTTGEVTSAVATSGCSNTSNNNTVAWTAY